MGYYIDRNGKYYEGDKANKRDLPVPRRPDPDHQWDFDTEEWICVEPEPVLESVEEYPVGMYDLFLIEKAKYILFRKNDNGTIKEQRYKSIEECKKYTGFDLTGKTYLKYLPDYYTYIDQSLNIDIQGKLWTFNDEIEKQKDFFDKVNLILNNIDTHISNYTDPYFGLTALERQSAEAKDALYKSDDEFVRVTEDLINVLIDKKIISLTDLPSAVQEKINNRKNLREKI